MRFFKNYYRIDRYDLINLTQKSMNKVKFSLIIIQESSKNFKFLFKSFKIKKKQTIFVEKLKGYFE